MAAEPLERTCGAKSKRTGLPCQKAPMAGKRRCYFHGGPSCGPKTVQGRENSRRAALKHGRFTKQAKAERARAREAMRALRKMLAILK